MPSHRPPATPSAHQKHLTVLVVDTTPFVSAHTALDTLPADDPDTPHTHLAAILQQYGGVVEQSQRDHPGQFVGLFGVPVAQEDDPQRAIRAALAMQEQVVTPESETPQPRKSAHTLCIGISSGPMQVFLAEQAEGYRVEGEAVTIAQQACQHAPSGGIVIAHDSYRLVKERFDIEPLPLDPPETLPFYLVQGEQAHAFNVPRGLELGSQIEIVSRAAEQRALREAFEAVAAQHTLRIITIEGETGLGKSRLLHEFNRWVEQKPETVRFFKGRVRPQVGNQPYALFRDLFAFRFGILDRDSPSAARTKIEQGVRAVLPTDSTLRAHLIGHLLGFDFSDSPYLRGLLDDARQLRDRAFHAITLFLEGMTSERSKAVRLMRSTAAPADRPLVVMYLEDLHWADEGSLELLAHLVRECLGLPLFIFALARPLLWERFPQWSRDFPPTLHHHLTLEPLSPVESQRLALELLGKVERVPPELTELLVGRTDGNPFYMEELIKMLIEDGVILVPPGAGAWSVATHRLATVQVPPTLMGVLQARLDALPASEREVLQHAALIGRFFWDSALERLFTERPDAAAWLRTTLEALQDKGLIVERQPFAFKTTREFLFKHTLLQEVAYGSVPKSRLKPCHAAIADWLIEWSEQQSDLWAAQIAEHFERAEQALFAALWYERAARYAKESHVPTAAIGYFQKALVLLPNEIQQRSRRAALYHGRAESLLQQARYAEAATAYSAMHDATPDALLQARAWAGLGDLQVKQGNYRAALESAQKSEERARLAGTSAQADLANALFQQSWARMKMGEMDAAFSLARQTFSLSFTLNSQTMMAKSKKLLGTILTTQGHRFEEAAEYFEEALALYRALEDQSGVALLLNNLGVLAFKRGDYATSVARYREALPIAHQIGSRDIETLVRDNLGEAYVGLGEYEAAETELSHVIEVAEAAGRAEFSSVAYSYLARALLGQGRLADAFRTAQRALALGQTTEESRHIGIAWYALGLTLAHPDAPALLAEARPTLEHQTPAACFAASLERFDAIGAQSERARVLRAWAQHEMAHGDPAHGHTLWQEARALFARLGLDPEVARMDEKEG